MPPRVYVGRRFFPAYRAISATLGATLGAPALLPSLSFLAGKAWPVVGGAALCRGSCLSDALRTPEQLGQGSSGGVCMLNLALTLGILGCLAPPKTRR